MSKRGKLTEDKVAKMITDYRLFTLKGLFEQVNWSWRLIKTKQDWNYNCSKHIYSVKFFNFTIYNERFIFFKHNTGRLSDANTKFVGNVYYLRYPTDYVDKAGISKSFGDVLAKAITLLDDNRFKHLAELLKPIS